MERLRERGGERGGRRKEGGQTCGESETAV
jgi:hypothetical protein